MTEQPILSLFTFYSGVTIISVPYPYKKCKCIYYSIINSPLDFHFSCIPPISQVTQRQLFLSPGSDRNSRDFLICHVVPWVQGRSSNLCISPFFLLGCESTQMLLVFVWTTAVYRDAMVLSHAHVPSTALPPGDVACFQAVSNLNYTQIIFLIFILY